MTLTECWECGEEVSTHAEKCPNCGAKHPESETAAKMEKGGEALQGCGAVLTLLVTIPILILFVAVMCA